MNIHPDQISVEMNKRAITITIGRRLYYLKAIINKYGLILYCILKEYFEKYEDFGSRIFVQLIVKIGATSYFHEHQHFELVLEEIVSQAVEGENEVYQYLVQLRILFEATNRYTQLEEFFKGNRHPRFNYLKRKIGYHITNQWNYDAEVFFLKLIADVEAMTVKRVLAVNDTIYTETKQKLLAIKIQ